MNTNNNNNTENNPLPEYLRGWKSEADTIAEFRMLKPSFHKVTLQTMRNRGKIVATKFAGRWFYKPETAFPPHNNSNSNRIW
jgi:hypothetical protein